jgi:hydrogenase expression/formation protein HypE
MAIMVARGNLEFEAEILSDTRPLTPLAAALRDAAGAGLRFMRDPTRGGVATVLNELARDCGWRALFGRSRVRCSRRPRR